ncbi:MAG: sugar transferase [Actinomycetota bacterium]|nr:sugar transferase [Actinomycetota bacterium]
MKAGLPRAADVVLALGSLAVALPLMAIAAVAIKLDSRGPVFFHQQRVGHRGALFEMWKLRTMTHGAPLGGIWDPLTADDPRVTKVGAWLRRTSLDELPNFFNVLRGEMAIVGPRPTIVEQVAEYTPHQRRRLDVKPGLTGWAQVNGRASLPWSERIELDVWYVENRSLWLDAQIIARTFRLLVSGRGLYEA